MNDFREKTLQVRALKKWATIIRFRTIKNLTLLLLHHFLGSLFIYLFLEMCSYWYIICFTLLFVR